MYQSRWLRPLYVWDYVALRLSEEGVGGILQSHPSPAEQPQANHKLGRGAPPRLRVAMYSHDTQGLGHIRRNLLVAAALRRHGGAISTILLLSGVREAAAFALPAGIDCLTLPSLGKDTNGGYYPRSLTVPMPDLIRIRTSAITAALRSFDPDLFIVDKVPVGALNELLPSLEMLRSVGRARIVLGLREILDDPQTVRQEWERGEYAEALRDYYDRIWVYGDPKVFDTADEYGFAPDLVRMARYTGYLNPQDVGSNGYRDGEEEAAAWMSAGAEARVIGLVGGGRDGLSLAEAFLSADLPAGMHGLLVTGPLMPDDARASLRALAQRRPRQHVIEFVTDPSRLLNYADMVIAMGGYNTICEILSFQKRALIVPRIKPRTEQLIRAKCFAGLGLVDMLHPNDLSPVKLTAWLSRGPEEPPRAHEVIDFNGVGELQRLYDEVVNCGRPPAELIHAVE